jgi:hypothetical protein
MKKTSLTWLHISDIHFLPKNEWRDSTARDSLVGYLKDMFHKDSSLRPDLVFCTGDIAFGETGSFLLSEQYKQAESFFDRLLAVCGQNDKPMPKERLFIVPGNHDINRKSIDDDAQATLIQKAEESNKHAEDINQRFDSRPPVFKNAIKRLDEYGQFLQDCLPHQQDENGRHCYARVVDINGLKIGIAGFNSAWSCSGPEDDRNLWLAAQWQFNAAKHELKDAALRIGLIHHPCEWLNQTDRDLAKQRISTDFHFWLHGHEHQSWVVPSQSNITIAAGAVGAQASEEFGVNLVQLDLAACAATVHLHQRKAGGTSWTIAPVEVHAPDGRWRIENLPSELRKLIPPAPPPVVHETTPILRRTKKLFGREALIKEAEDKLNRQPFLLVYGLRGNGKSSIIRELEKQAPLVGKESNTHFYVNQFMSADELFRQFAVLLGERAEFPRAPQGDPKTIATEIQRRYPHPKSAWIWIDRAHLLLKGNGFQDQKIYNLLLGLHIALRKQWHFLLELRERPPQGMFANCSCECEVPGLNKQNLADWLRDEAPVGREDEWNYNGSKLKSIYQWLGGGHGYQAHPQAVELLILVARERNESPLEVLKRHLGSFEEKIEEKLLGDLYYNVLNATEQYMLQALALYRTAIPHDHADALEHHLNIPNAWDGIDRRCLLAVSANHAEYFLHSFIAGWVRTRSLQYAGHGEEDHADFLQSTPEHVRKRARDLHAAVATCWLDQLRISRRATNLSITRALEAFHHLVSAGDGVRVQDIAVELLTGNLLWAQQRIESLDNHLFKTKAPVSRRREVLQYWAALEPDSHKVQRFLGECWQKEEGRKSRKALQCFEKACSLRTDYPQYWANLGKALLAQGREGAAKFLARLAQLEQDCPQAINDYVRAVQFDCYTLLGDNVQAAALRMAKINAGSRNPVFYADEAKARLAAGNSSGALEILDLAVSNGCADDYTEAIRASVLRKTDED